MIGETNVHAQDNSGDENYFAKSTETVEIHHMMDMTVPENPERNKNDGNCEVICEW